MDDLYAKHIKSKKFYDYELEELIEVYTNKLKELKDADEG